MAAKKPRTDRTRRPDARLRVEPLEDRAVPAAANVFAEFGGTLATAADAKAVPITLSAADFTLAGGKTVLGFHVTAAAGSTLDPAAVTITGAGGAAVSTRLSNANVASGNGKASLVVVELAAGTYTVTVRGEKGTSGGFVLSAFLAGDQDGSRAVTTTDGTVIRSMQAGTTPYALAADSNLDKAISSFDYSQWRDNSGDATTLNPLTNAAVLDPAPTPLPGGQQGTTAAALTLRGTTLPSRTVRLETGTDGNFDDGTTTSDATGKYSFAVSPAEGANTFRTRASDGFGQTADAAVSVVRDSTAPAVQVTGPTGNPAVNANPAVTGTVADAGTGLASFEAAVDGGAYAPVTVGAGGAFSFTPALALDGSADGSHTVHLRATDRLGNQTTADVPFVLDTRLPVVTLTSPAAGAVTTASVAVAGRATDAGSGVVKVQVAFDGGAFADAVTSGFDPFGFTATVPPPAAEGPHTLRVRAVDAAGNISAVAERAFTIAAPPTAPVFDLASTSDTGAKGDRETAATRVLLTGMADPDIALTLLPSGATTVASHSGFFQFTGVELADGDNVLTVRATNAAGAGTEASITVRRAGTLGTDVVLEWNLNLLEAVRRDASTPPVASRIMAIVQGAVLDAVNAVQGTPGYFVRLTAPAVVSAEAAVAAAAHRALVYYYPAQQATLDGQLAATLAGIADEAAKVNGVALGRAAADAVIGIRDGDGWDRFVIYPGGTNPGQWRPTPLAYMEALLPQWGQVTPFVIGAAADYRAPAPPPLSSQQYADAYNEVKRLGRVTGSTRTADETQIARFWADGAGSHTPPGHWNMIARGLATARGNSLAENARLFAQLNFAEADTGIAVWETKYFYGFWRPITAIEEAAADGNPLTEAEDGWVPLINTPPFPDYTSGHSGFSWAAATILAAYYGDTYSFSTTSFTLPGVTRTYASLSQAAAEAGRSRIFGGIHWQFANLGAEGQGRAVGAAVLDAFDLSTDDVPARVYFDAPPPETAAATNFTIRGHALDNLSGVKRVEVKLDAGAFAAVTVDASGNFSFPTAFALDGSADGRHTLAVRTFDWAGNESAPVALPFTLDTRPPALTLTSPADGADLAADARLTGTADGTGSAVAGVTYVFDGGAPMSVAVNTATGAFDAPLDQTGLDPGPHALAVTVRDAAGLTRTTTLTVNVPGVIALAVTSHTPSDGSIDVGVTFRPQVFFSRPIDATTLNSNNFYASFGGAKLPAAIVPADDGTFAWLFFDTPMPDASLVRVTVDGSSIRAADGALLDADRDGTPGGVLTYDYKTVNLVPVANTSLVGVIADPGPDLKPMTADDARTGPDGLYGTADDIILLPLAGVKVYLIGLEDQAVVTGANGRFTFPAVPVGNTKVVLDGLTVPESARPAGFYYPEMVLDVDIAPGVSNTLMEDMFAAYLPRVATSVLKPVDAASGATLVAEPAGAPNLTPEQRALLTIEVAPGSLVGADGQKVAAGTIGISTVPPELVMDMLPPGVLQHTFDITVQALGTTNFSRPAKMTFPNVFNAPPGTKLDFLSFDHTTGRLVIEGTATVSADGEYAATDPGTGVTHPGWHGLTPPGGCGGSGGPPPQPTPPQPGETLVENPPQAFKLAFGDTEDMGFPLLSFNAPANNPNVPPLPPVPGCQVPPHNPNQQQQPFKNVTVEIDGPLADFAKPIAGGLPLTGQAFTLSPGSASKKFDFDTKSFTELLGANKFKGLETNRLYGSKIKVTVIDQNPDGSRVRTVDTYYVHRFLDATDDKHTDKTIEFEDTIVDGLFKVERNKPLDIRAYAGGPKITDDPGEPFFVLDSGKKINFDPTTAGEDRKGELTITTPDGKDVPDRIQLLGDATPKFKINANKAGLEATLKAIADGTAANLRNHLITATEKAMFDTAAEREAISKAVMEGIADRYSGYPGGVEVVNANGADTVQITWTTTANAGLFGDSGPSVGGDGVDNATKAVAATNNRNNVSKAERDFAMAASLQQGQAAGAGNYATTVEVYVDTHLENGFQPGSGLNLTAAELTNALILTTAHEAGHTFGLVHTAQVTGIATTTAAVQKLTLAGGVAGDDFDLSFGGATTKKLALGASAADVQAALRGLATITGTNVNVAGAGTAASPYTVTFVGDMAGFDDIPVITGTGKNALTVTGATVTVGANKFTGIETTVGGTGGRTDIMYGGNLDTPGAGRFVARMSAEALRIGFKVDWTRADMDAYYNNIASFGNTAFSGTPGVGGGAPPGDGDDFAGFTGPRLAISEAGGALVYGALDFGAVAVDGPGGTAAARTLTLRNFGTEPVVLTSFAVGTSGRFAASPVAPGTTLAPGATMTVDVTFDPTDVGAQTATITVSSNDPTAQPEIALAGFGQALLPNGAVTAGYNNLGGVRVASGTAARADLATVTNRGAQPLVVSAVRLVEGVGRFTLTGLPSDLGTNPISLAFGESFTFGATFDPDRVGLDRAVVEVVTNDPSHPVHRFTVVGTGLDAVVYPEWGNDFQAIDTPDVPGAPVLLATSDDNGNFSFFLPAETAYRYRSFDPVTGQIAYSYGTTPASGRGIDLTATLVFGASTAPDSDYDGLPDDIEETVGTRTDRRDTNTDGIDDFTAVQQQIDAIGEDALPVGIVGTVRPAGTVVDVVASSNTAYLAAQEGGVQVVDITRLTKPAVIASVPASALGGGALAVAFTSVPGATAGTFQNLVVAALGDAGLAVLDVTDPPAARVLTRIPVPGSALHVEVVDNLAYAGGHGGLVTIVDMKTREVLSTFTAAGTGDVTDLKFSGGTLYTLRGGTLASYDIARNLAAPPLRSSLAIGGEHLFVGTDRAYVTGNQVFEAVDISNPSSLRNTSGARPALSYSGLAANGSGRLVVGSTANFNGDFRATLFNTADPDNTNGFLTEFDTPGQVRDVWIQNGLALIADGTGGFAVFNYLPLDTGTSAPAVTVTTDGPSATTAVEGQRLRVDVTTLDDVQTRQVRVVANGVALEPDGSFPFSFFADVPTLASGATTLTLEITATDTGGNETTVVRVLDVVADTTAPRLLSTLPADDRIQFNSVQAFRATFDEPLDLATVTAASVRVVEAGADGDLGTSDDISVPLGGFDYRASLNLLTVLPAAPLGPGKYELQIDRPEVTDRAGNPLGTGVFRSQFTVQAIPFNAVIPGSIDQPGEIDLFSFRARAGDVVTLWGDWSVGLGNGQISLLGVDGSTVLATAEGAGSSLLPSVGLPADGLYTVRVRAASDRALTTGAYRFTISDPETAAETIAYGQTKTGAMAVRGDAQEWEFAGTAGDLLNLSYVGPTLENGVAVLAPDGTTAATLPAGSTLVLAAVPLTQTGTYRFVLNSDRNPGSYTLQLDQGRFGDEVAGLFNLVQGGSLTRLYEVDRFRYRLAAGDVVTVFANFAGIGSGRLRLLDAATGAELVAPKTGGSAQFGDFLNAVGRDVIVEVAGASGSGFHTGTYTLSVSDPETAAEAIGFGQEKTGTFAVRGDAQEWQFTAAGGEVVTLGYRGPGLADGITVRNPDGTVLATLPTGGTLVGRDLVLAQAGTYRFVLADGFAVGEYKLNLSNPADVESPGIPLAANTARAEDIGTVFDIDVFTFAAAGGDAFAVVAEFAPGGAGLNGGELQLIAPGGAVVGTASGPGAVSVSVPAAAAGTYTARVRARAGNDFATGAYRLTAYRGAEDPTNDTLGSAVLTGVRDAGLGQFVGTGFIGDNVHGVKDVDVYRVTASRGDQIVADLETAGRGDLGGYVRLFDAAGNPLSGGGRVSYTVLAAGTYYVGVSSSGNTGYNPAAAGSGAGGSVGGYRLTLNVAQDNTGPTVTVSPTGVTPRDDINRFVATFNERLNPASAADPANYLLVSSGPDGVFDTADDTAVALTPVYSDGTRQVTLATADGPDGGTDPDPLPVGFGYRLTLKGAGPGAITDIAGNPLKDGVDEVVYLILPNPQEVTGTPTTTFPLTDGFEAGGLASYWSVAASGGALVEATTLDTPHAGTFHARMRNPGSAGRVGLILNVDLTGLAAGADVDLSFFHRDGGDGNESMPATFAGRVNADGVAFSPDGVNWYRLADLGSTTDGSYATRVIDLDGAVRAAGVSFTPTFQVLFQHYLGSGQAAYFDDIRLAADLAGPTVTAVSATGPLVFSSSLTAITVDFSEPLQATAAGAATSYQLRRTDTGAVVAVTPTYDGDRRVTLGFGALAQAPYQLRVRGDSSVGGTTQVRDLNGNLLNDGADSVYTFEVIAVEATPDDETDTATASGLTSGGSFTKTTAIGNNTYAGRDVDLYRFTARAGDRLTASTVSQSFGAAGLNTLLRLFDADGRQLTSNDDLGGFSTDSRIDGFQMPATGTYYLGVSSSGNAGYNPGIAPSGTSGPQGKYQVSGSLTPDTTAPTVAHAVPHAGPNANQSIAAVTVQFSELIPAALASDPANYALLALGADRAVGGGDDTPVAFTTAYDAASFTATLTLTGPAALLPLPAGAYRLTVRGTAGGIADLAGNRLNGGSSTVQDFSVIRPEDPLNDRLADATETGIPVDGGAYTVGAAVGDNAFGNLDVDLYRLQARDGLRLTVSLTDRGIDSPLSARVRLFDAAGNQLAASENTSGNESFTYDVTAEGTYYVGVSGSGNPFYNPLSPGSGSAATTTGEYVLALTAADVTDPAVVSVAPDGIVVGATTRVVSVRFSEPMDVTAAETAANYRLRHSGPDRVFGNGDDADLAFAVAYDIGARTARLTAAAGIPDGDVRVTLKGSGLTDRGGRHLAGGADVVRSFSVVAAGLTPPAIEPLDAAPLPAYWVLQQADPNARAEVGTAGGPRRGAGHLLLTNAVNYAERTATAVLAVNAAAGGPLGLSFYANPFTYSYRYTLPSSFSGNALGDGVAIGVDGTNWVRVVDLAGAPDDTFTHYTVDLAAAAAAAGLPLTGLLLVRFSNTEYYTASSSGGNTYYTLAVDDIRVGADAVAPVATGLVQTAFHHAASTTALGVTFSEPLAAATATDPANYAVTRAGADLLLGTADDVTVTPTGVAYDNPSRTVTLSFAGPLPQDAYRVTAKPGITDLSGLPLNDGLAQALSLDVSTTEAAENDTLGTATATGIVAGVAGDFAATSAVGNNARGTRDVDLYALDTAGGDRLAVSLRRYGVNVPNLRVRVFNAAGAEVATATTTSSADTANLVLFLSAAGRYYVGVSGSANGGYDPAVAGSGSAADRGLYTLAVQTRGGVAVPPQDDGFEAAALASYWTTYAADATGLVGPSTNLAHAGARSLILGDTNYDYTLVEATLTLDATALPHTDLSFYAYRTYYELGNPLNPAGGSFTNHFNGDGVAFSVDGTTWYVLADFSTLGSGAWTRYALDLNAAAAAAGVALTATTRVRFQNYAYGPASASYFSYGLYVDDVRLAADLIAPRVAAMPGLDGFAVAADLADLPVTFSEPVEPGTANRAANYALRAAGPDGVFGTDDDADLAVTPAYDEATRTTTLAIAGAGAGLPAGTYRLRLDGSGVDGLRDPAGNPFADGQTKDFVFAVFPPEGTRNNTMATATPVPLGPGGGVYRTAGMVGNDGPGRAATFADVDLYRVDAAAGQVLYVTATAWPGAALQPNLRVRVFDAAGAPILFADGSDNNAFLDGLRLAAGTYYVGVAASDNDAYDPATGTGDVGTTRGVYDLAVQVLTPAALGFADGFEPGAIDPGVWEVRGHDGGTARAEGTSPTPLAGAYSAVLSKPAYRYAQTDLTLHLNLAGAADAELRFLERNNYDYDYGYTYPTSYPGRYYGADGVFLSTDGTTYYRLPDVFNGAPGGTVARVVDLDEFAALNGLTLGADVRVRFQAYHYYYDGETGGRSVDDVRVIVDTAGPKVTRLATDGGNTSPSVLSDNVTAFTATFDDRLDAARAGAAAGYELRFAGADGKFAGQPGDAGDDVVVPLAPSYDGGFGVTLAVPAGSLPLSPGAYRLTLRGAGGAALRDREGNLLNDGADEVRPYTLVDGGPRVTASTPAENAVVSPADGFSAVALTFSEPVLASTFSAADIVITDQTGARAVATADITLTGSGKDWSVSFPTLGGPAAYTVTVGPDVTDLLGNRMNQNRNLVSGESFGDAFALHVRVTDTATTTLIGTNGYRYDVQPYYGDLNDGGKVNPATGGTTHGDSYDGMYYLQVGDEGYYNPDTVYALEDGGRTVVMPDRALAGLRVRREVYVPAAGGEFARYLEVLTNPTAATVTRRVTVYGNLGSDGSTVVFLSSGGDTVFGPDDTYLGTDDADGTGDLTLGHVFMDGDRLRLAAAFRSGSDNLYWSFDVGIGPGQTVRVMTLVTQQLNRSDTTARLAELVGLGGGALDGLTDAEKGTIVNFDTGLDTLAPVVAASAPDLSGVVLPAVSEVALTFSEPMAAGPAGDGANYTLVEAGPDGAFDTGDEVVVGLTVAYDPSTRLAVLTIDPGAAPLPAGLYRLTLSGALADLAGNPLAAGSREFVFTVSTSGAAVTSFYPGTMDPYSGWYYFDLTFDHPIDPATFDGSDVIVFDPFGNVVVPAGDASVYQLSGDGTYWQVYFGGVYVDGLYEVRVGPDVYDVYGRPMNQDGDDANGEDPDDVYSVLVDVEVPPAVSSIDARADSVSIFFTEAMNPSTAGDASFYSLTWTGDDGALGTDDDQIVPLTAVMGEGGTAVTLFFPPEWTPLPFGEYWLYVDGGVTDLNGNLLYGGSFSTPFTLSPL